MNIKRISLCQNENWDYSNLPRDLNSDYKPCYDFAYPFSNEIALDCERVVYKLKENNISSDVCWHLAITFINTKVVQNDELIDFIAFGQRKMRFINIAKDANEFNLMTQKEKRKYLLDSICNAIMLVTDDTYNDIIIKITNEVFEFADNTECVYLKKCTKKYCAVAIFKSSLKGYDATLYVQNNKTKEKEKFVLFENASYADLEYRIHKIIFKGKQCIIQPKNDDYNFDKPIVVELC